MLFRVERLIRNKIMKICSWLGSGAVKENRAREEDRELFLQGDWCKLHGMVRECLPEKVTLVSLKVTLP